MAGKLNIYLIGLSGTGKTRSGQLVAEVLGWPFVEMDGVIEDRCGKTIPDIFKDNGEHYFRDLESQILEEVAERGGRVVSTGGGVPIRSQNRKTMNSTGLVIYNPKNLAERIKGMKNKNVSREQKIKERLMYEKNAQSQVVN